MDFASPLVPGLEEPVWLIGDEASNAASLTGGLTFTARVRVERDPLHDAVQP